MALITIAAAGGTDFDGTPGQGEVLSGTLAEKDPDRMLIQSIGISAAGNLADAFVRMAPTLGDATGDLFLEILTMGGTAAPGVSKIGCRLLVPAGWNIYFFSTEAAPVSKNAILDFRRIQYAPSIT